MSWTDVMYGPLGQVNNNFQANLGQNAAMNQQNQYAAQQQQAAAAQQQAQLAALYGPQGFGGQTAAYAAAGAAYGRATGGFNGYGYQPAGGGSAPLGASGPGEWGTGPNGDPQWIPSGGGGSAPAAQPDFSQLWSSRTAPQVPQPAQSPAVDWGQYFQQLTAPVSPYSYNSGSAPLGASGSGAWGTGPNGDPQWIPSGGGGVPSAAPDPYATLGYNPGALYQNAMGYPGGAMSAYFNPATYGSFGMGVPAGYQPPQDQRYWSGNFFGANNGAGIGQGAGVAPGYGGFNNPAGTSFTGQDIWSPSSAGSGS